MWYDLARDYRYFTIAGAHYPERATSLYSCNGVFTSSFIFRYAFPAKITVSGYVRIETNLIKKMAAKLRFFLVLYSVLRSSFSIIPIRNLHQLAFPQYHAFYLHFPHVKLRHIFA